MFPKLPPTPLDFTFRLGTIPVHVRGWFWAGASVLGWNQLMAGQADGENFGLPLLLGWLLAVFISIVVHELGHVLAMRTFGGNGWISLEPFGGLAHPTHTRRFTTWREVAVALAGPLAQMPLLALTFLLMTLTTAFVPAIGSRLGWLWNSFLLNMMIINIVWPLLNLMPIGALDGGRVSTELFLRYSSTPYVWIDRVGIGTAVILGTFAFVIQDFYLIMLICYLVLPHVERVKSGGL